MIGRVAMGAMLLMTSACISVVPMDDDMPAEGDNRLCDADQAQRLVGELASSELGAEALRLTGARGLRWIQPGQAVTMDYRPDRLNVKLDAQNRVEQFTCG